MSTDQLDEFVTAYYGRRLRHKTARAHLQGIVGKYGWTLWGCIQNGSSAIDFDFWEWAMERYEAAVAEFRGPNLARLLDDVQADRLMAIELPDRAHVVIIGGGVIGTSVAYHLTKLGLTDVVLLEQGQLSSGTTWHAAGLVGQLRASESATRLVQYSTQLYAELEDETGLSAGYKQCGGVTVARTEDRMIQLRRTAANAAAFNMECELLSPEQALEHYPVMRVDDLVGAIWLPADGKANPTDLTFALAKGARMRGTRVVEKTRVTGILTRDGRVTGVRTDAGDIEAEIVVNCAGQWAKQVGAMAGVNVPLHSAEHFYVVTEDIDGVHPDLPILRDPDGYTYFKEEVGGLVIGGFEPEAKPWVSPDDIPYPFEFQLLEEDWDHFEILMNNALAADPRARGDRHQEVLQRPGELHPRQPVHPRRGARTRATSSSAPDSTRWASPPRAVRAGRWRSGSSTAHPPATSPASTSAASRRSTATAAGCTTGSPRSSACTTKSPGPTGK